MMSQFKRRLAPLGLLLAGCIALVACGGGDPKPRSDLDTVRQTALGEVLGLTNSRGGHEWRGIPFAAPPVGDLRWRAPRPASPWQDLRPAISFPPWCAYQTNAFDEANGVKPKLLRGEEDCLYLNVYAPAFEPNAVPRGPERLPVMVWVHGGGNVWGGSDQYDASNLATSQNVLVVTIQYRLGPLGWLAAPELRQSANMEADTSANFGTLDQIAALEWVRANIASFGGDPDRVTLFGESAGARNIHALLVSPRAKGLFHGAILQSSNVGYFALDEAEGHAPPHDPRVPQKTHEVIDRLLVDFQTASMEDRAAALRAMPLQDVFNAFPVIEGDFLMIPNIIADGVVVPEDGVLQPLSDPARFNSVPLLIGTNRDETKLFNFLDERLMAATFNLMHRPRDRDLYEGISKYQSLAWRILSVDRPARLLSEGGHSPVYAYRFDWDEQNSFLGSDYGDLVGAAHGMEIPFVFGHFEFFGQVDRLFFTKKNAPPRTRLSNAMMSYWAEFAYTGAPGRGRDDALPEWTAWQAGEAGEPARLLFDTPVFEGGIRTHSGEASIDTLLQAMGADRRFDTTAKRCRVFEAVAEWYPEVAERRADYLNGACTATMGTG